MTTCSVATTSMLIAIACAGFTGCGEPGYEFGIISDRGKGELFIAWIPVLRKPGTDDSGACEGCPPRGIAVDEINLGTQLCQMKRCARADDSSSNNDNSHEVGI